MTQWTDFGFWIGDVGLKQPAACGIGKSPIHNPQSKIQNPTPRSAFTLIEVLVAIALVLALVGTMYGFLFDMLSARRRVIEHVRTDTAASALIKQLDAELHTCIVGDSVFGSGVQGNARHMKILSRGVAAHLAGRGAEDPDVFGDLQVAEYRFDEVNRRIEGRRGPALASGATPPPFAPLEGAVHRVRFRYHDGAQWQTSFDSRVSNRLPLAVEVAVWYGSEEADGEISANDVTEERRAESPLADESAAQEQLPIAASPEDAEESPVPPPDRVRIILIPDAGQVQLAPEAGGAP